MDVDARYPRHEEFYVEDGNMIILAGGVLFNLHRGVVGLHSEVLKLLMDIPEGITGIGHSDENPLVLAHLTRRHFEALCMYLYSREHNRASLDESEVYLVALLDFSSTFDGHLIRDYAVARLRSLALPHSRRLELARTFFLTEPHHVMYWVRQPIQVLVQSPGGLSSLSALDLEKVGSVITAAFISYEFELAAARLTIAAYTPGLDQDGQDRVTFGPRGKCTPEAHGRCLVTWHEMWQLVIAKAINNPRPPLEFHRIRAYIRTASENEAWKEIHAECRNAFLNALSSTAIFNEDNRLLSKLQSSAVEACRRP